MQENEFEKKIRLKMDELQMVPGEEVWKKVSADIQKEKSKRRFLFFLVAFTFLAGTTALYFYINSNKTLPVFADNNKHVQTDDSANKKSTGSIKPKGDSEVSNLSQKTIKTVADDQIAAIKKQDVSYNNHKQLRGYLQRSQIKKSQSSSVISNKKTGADNVSASVTKEPVNGLSKSNIQSFIQQKEVVQDPQEGKADSAKEKPLDKQIPEIKKDSSKLPVAEKPVKKIKIWRGKKWAIGFTAFSGISNNLSGLFGGGAAGYSNALPASAGSVNSSSAINKLSYKSGFSYSAGIYVKKQVSKTIGFSAGADYHFASAASLAGSRNSTTQTFYDAGFQSNATVSAYYNNGQSVEYRNKYYLLELPLNVFVQLNKNRNKPISFTAGISPAYLLSSKALYANINQNVYYENKEQFRKLLIMAQAGVQFKVFNTTHFNIAAGPEVRYGLNNMAKPATATNQHLSSAGVKVLVTLQ